MTSDDESDDSNKSEASDEDSGEEAALSGTEAAGTAEAALEEVAGLKAQDSLPSESSESAVDDS